MTRSIQNSFGGHISKTALLTALLPLSFTLFFGTLSTAALFFPTGYDWRVRVISALTSPHDNPRGCWLPGLGIIAAMLLVLPCAGYVADRLRATAPLLARLAGLAFALSFSLLLLAVTVQLAQPVIGLRWLHELLARGAAGIFVAGMFCCCACGLKDRLRCFGGQGSLSATLTFYWGSLTLLPIGCLVSIGVLVLLGQQLGQTWAEDLRQSFRHTILWKLAFWEWIGALVAFAFMVGSILLLPVSRGERRTESGPTSKLAEARMSTVRGPRKPATPARTEPAPG